MYNANASYEENYRNGPDAHFLKNGRFPKIKYNEAPRFSFLGVPLHIPFGVASGPLLNSNYMRAALDAGFCLPVYKTVRSRAWASNQWPNVLNLQAKESSLFATELNEVTGLPFSPEDYKKRKFSISNSFGSPSQSPEVWHKDFQTLSAYGNEPGLSVSLSFQGSREDKSSPKETKTAFYDDIHKVTEQAVNCVQKAGFSLLEINLSCPNEVQAPLYKDLPSAIHAIKSAHEVLSSYPNVKLVAKIGVLTAEETKLFLGETQGILHGVSAINTILAKVFTPAGKIALGSGSLTGGVCGSLIFEQGVRMVALLAETREKLGLKKENLGIIGVGGVFDLAGFRSYISAGADLVQSATGMMWNLGLATEIADDLKVHYDSKR